MLIRFALQVLMPLFLFQVAAPGRAAAEETIWPSGSNWPPSSSITTPLHSRLQPWSG
jgi:hypothetical protein